ncbi:FecR family protein [Steroidobacter agaridevorans]|uniref:FecR family protein n=1 Tax=Steroidobacter agaridevorans TaxID=2695856 RepID=UPI00137A8BAA|nr:FecR domain-containing protein [Steroidobacter agaridevorans]
MRDDLSFSKKCLAYLRQSLGLPFYLYQKCLGYLGGSLALLVHLYETWLVIWRVNQQLQDRSPTAARESDKAAKNADKAAKIISVNWWKGSSYRAAEFAMPRRSPWIRRVAVFATTSIATFVVVAGASYLSAGVTYETAADETRIARLTDGSRIELKGSAKLKVLFSAERRLIRHMAGQLFITAAPDAQRPLVIETALAELVLPDMVPGAMLGIWATASMTIVTAHGNAVLLSVRRSARQKIPLLVKVRPGKPYRIPPEDSRTAALLGTRRST